MHLCCRLTGSPGRGGNSHLTDAIPQFLGVRASGVWPKGPVNNKLSGVSHLCSGHLSSLGVLPASPHVVLFTGGRVCPLQRIVSSLGTGACAVSSLSHYPAQARDIYGHTHSCLFQEEMAKRYWESLMAQVGGKWLPHLAPFRDLRPRCFFPPPLSSSTPTSDHSGLP